jgi:hypothetical protein
MLLSLEKYWPDHGCAAMIGRVFKIPGMPDANSERKPPKKRENHCAEQS